MGSRVRAKKKRRWLRLSLLSLFTFFILIAVFCIYQYKNGVSEASSGQINQKVFGDFKGSEPHYGELNVLLLGSDSRGEAHARSDTLMIAHYDQKSHQLKLASIMRDTYVDVPGHGKQKINAAFAFGGPELVRQTLKENFGVDINYYAIVDFEGFSKLVDIIAPKGIAVNIPYKMSYGIGMTLEPGKQVLHGDKLLGYVRFRHDRLSDFGRVERQQEVLQKIKDQAVRVQNIVKLPKLLGTATPYIETNIDTPTLLSIGKGLITEKSKKIDTLRIPVQNSYENERVNVGDVLNIDLEKNKQALNDFLNSSEEEGRSQK
ncbi:transcriptional regulator [Pullulanibacillus camelliae]|uniref:Regulatory protein MsrR n=1 Tax=Pullulanibacillus camelliae TaxID=1707096 RepID=A0A8J2YGI1_9BACL|nr:LCP family protein [Pullulanibacillus camelliae]GGE39268.1 transcriptional regulator [Pullulanibacillus camelliae]